MPVQLPAGRVGTDVGERELDGEGVGIREAACVGAVVLEAAGDGEGTAGLPQPHSAPATKPRLATAATERPAR
jgi:hypothetical protein